MRAKRVAIDDRLNNKERQVEKERENITLAKDNNVGQRQGNSTRETPIYIQDNSVSNLSSFKMMIKCYTGLKRVGSENITDTGTSIENNKLVEDGTSIESIKFSPYTIPILSITVFIPK